MVPGQDAANHFMHRARRMGVESGKESRDGDAVEGTVLAGTFNEPHSGEFDPKKHL
jgi:hypothetical protein